MCQLYGTLNIWLILAAVAAPTMPPCARCPRSRKPLRTSLKLCHLPLAIERYTLSHMTPPDESTPRPCTAAVCTYAHNPGQAAAELAALLQS
eukprot:3244454-Pleurochrysis_carterae.AAC.2